LTRGVPSKASDVTHSLLTFVFVTGITGQSLTGDLEVPSKSSDVTQSLLTFSSVNE